MSRIKINDLSPDQMPSPGGLERIKGGGIPDGTSNTIMIGETTTSRIPREIIITGVKVREN